jgi:peptidoglycan/xylan/chitin deacetylase (PgdA/CDA1 family)
MFAALLLAAAVAIVAAVVATRVPPSWVVVAGGAIVAVAAWLLTQTDALPLRAAIAMALGAGTGLVAAGAHRLGGSRLAALALVSALAATAVGVFALIAVTTNFGTACAVAAGIAIGAGNTRVAVDPSTRVSATRTSVAVFVAATLVMLSCTLWIGANSASAGWFGSLVSHGPRNRPEVALTFDDGPNATTTLAVRDILDQYGVKATFFEVGKAIRSRPDISRALLRDGELLANHSYHHDSTRWLDPRYLELSRTQQVFARDVRVCPTFFRPPHGQHTPFMARIVEDHDMTMVTWDVSAGDWATNDAPLVARRILAGVRPGSIILLHDGLDGRVDVDRTVLVRALPMILQGLRRRGLQPVRLDVLLHRPAYGGRCS